MATMYVLSHIHVASLPPCMCKIYLEHTGILNLQLLQQPFTVHFQNIIISTKVKLKLIVSERGKTEK